MAAALVALANYTVPAGYGVASFSITNIPTSTYRDLYLVAQVKMIAADDQLMIRFNGDTGGNYNYVWMRGTGSATASGTTFSQSFFDWYPSTESTDFNKMVRLSILDAGATDKHKVLLTRADKASGTGQVNAYANAGRWASTSAITSMSFTGFNNWIAPGSTFALFGVVA